MVSKSKEFEIITKYKYKQNMKTKVTVLAEEIKKPIVLEGILRKGCEKIDYYSPESDVLKTSRFKEVILISRGYGSKDISLCKKHNGDEAIMFGKFNDGVV